MSNQRGLISLPQVLALGPLPLLLIAWQDWYVDVSASPCPGGDGTQAQPFCTINAAVAVATDGDTIHVAPGTYLENVVLNKDLDIIGTGGQAVTIVDGQASGSVVEVRLANVTLTGLSLTNGAYDGSQYPESYGGGLFASGGSVTLSSCSVTGNSGAGGLFLFGASATVSDVLVQGNIGYQGGGIHVGSNASATVDRSAIRDNVAVHPGGYGEGGGLFVGACVLTGCPVGSSPGVLLLTNSTISGNLATGHYGGDGGAIRSLGDLRIVNSAVTGNYADAYFSGIVALGPTSLVNVTLSSNGDGLAIGDLGCGVAEVSNCIVWGNGPRSLVTFGCGTTTVQHSLIEGGWPGAGNFDADPLFVAPQRGDFRLRIGSPCIDAGDNTAVPSGVVTDLRGFQRFFDDPSTPDTGVGSAPMVDMGAFELGHHDRIRRR